MSLEKRQIWSPMLVKLSKDKVKAQSRPILLRGYDLRSTYATKGSLNQFELDFFNIQARNKNPIWVVKLIALDLTLFQVSNNTIPQR